MPIFYERVTFVADEKIAFRVSDLVKHSLVYSIGTAVVAGSGILLLPIYTRFLSTEEFGGLEILNRIADIMLVFMFLGMRQAFIRLYFDHFDDEWRNKVTSTFIWFSFISCLAIVAGLYPWAGEAVSLFYDSPELQDTFALLLIVAPFSMFSMIVMTYFQVNTRSAAYVLSISVQVVLFIGLTAVFLIRLDMGVEGALLAKVASAGLIATIGTAYIFRNVGYKFSFSIFADMLKFGLPYLPTAILMYVIVNADRYFLSSYESLESVGIYALSYKVAMLGGIILMEPFLKIWSPFLYRVIDMDGGKQLIADVFRYFIIFTIGVSTLISLLAGSIIPLLSDEAYYSAIQYVPVLALASALYAALHIADVGILVMKKTKFKPLIFGLGAITAVSFNWILVERFGILGASIATCSSFLVLLIATAITSNHFLYLPIEYSKLILTIVAGVGTYIVAFAVTGETNGMTNTILSLLCFLLYPATIWVVGVLSESEKLAIRNVLLGKQQLHRD